MGIGQDPNEPPISGEGAAIEIGGDKPLSTAMKCVLSLTILYFAVIVRLPSRCAHGENVWSE